MRFLALGDLHIVKSRMHLLPAIDQYCLKNNIDFVMQVGDFGLHWPGEQCKAMKYFDKRARQLRPGPHWITVLGNHDNWNVFEENLADEAEKLNIPKDEVKLIPYAPTLYATNRPTYLELLGGCLFLGGAVSTDADPVYPSGWSNDSRSGRVENETWWANEAPSLQELQMFVDLLEEKKPKYVFTHDGPESGHYSRGGGLCKKSNRRYDEVSRAYETILASSNHQPLHWFFGHHHEMTSDKTYRTTTHCCGLHGEGWIVDDETNTVTPLTPKDL